MRFLRVFERLAFGLFIVLIPVRLRTTIWELPVAGIFPDFTDALLFAADACLLAVLVLWGVRRGMGGGRISFGPGFLSWPLLAFVLLGGASWGFSEAPPMTLHHVARLGLMFGLYLYVLNEVRSLREIALPLALQVALQAVVAVTQSLLQHSLGLRSLSEYPLDPAHGGVSIVWAGERLALRAYGLTDHPNILGGSLALGLVLLAVVWWRASPGWRPVLAFTFALGAAALLLTFSRAAWVALAAGGLVMAALLVARRKLRMLGELTVLALGSLLIVLPFVLVNLPFLGMRLEIPATLPAADAPLLSPEETSFLERFALNEAAIRIFKERPLTGVGLGAFPIALHSRLPDFRFEPQPVHIVLLLAAAELGLPGGLVYLWVTLSPWAAFWLARRRVRLTPGLVAASGALAVSAVIGLFDYYLWWLPTGQFWQWLVWGLWAGFFQAAQRGQPECDQQGKQGEDAP